MLDFVDKLPRVDNKPAFIFSTCGVPAFALTNGYVNDYIKKAHSSLKDKLQSKGYNLIGEFMCAGFNTNSFLKFFGGINKGRPNADDLQKARDFAMKLKNDTQ